MSVWTEFLLQPFKGTNVQKLSFKISTTLDPLIIHCIVIECLNYQSAFGAYDKSVNTTDKSSCYNDS